MKNKKLVIVSLSAVLISISLFISIGILFFRAPVNVTADDFRLTIKTTCGSTSFYQGEDIEIDVTLENLSGRSFEIAVFFLLYPGEGWRFARIYPPYPSVKNFRRSGAIRQVENLSWYYDLSIGTYQLQYRAVFFVNWGRSSQERIEVESNIVELTIL